MITINGDIGPPYPEDQPLCPSCGHLMFRPMVPVFQAVQPWTCLNDGTRLTGTFE